MQDRQEVKSLVRGCYDVQKLRIQTGNRIVANVRAKLGMNEGEDEEAAKREGNKLLDELRRDYRRITDGMKRVPNSSFKFDGVIADLAQFFLLEQYDSLLTVEETHFKRIGRVLEGYPIYTEFLEKVKGIGPAMAGVIVSEIDISRAAYASSLWKYAGLDVAGDGAGRSRKKQHLVRVQYTDKDGEESERDSITFNPFLKTKLVGVLGPSFLRSHSPYAEEFYNYRTRIENHPAHKDKTPGHRKNMAVRYMVKRFLVDLYAAWRAIEGLPVAPEYSEGKLGMVHRQAA